MICERLAGAMALLLAVASAAQAAEPPLVDLPGLYPEGPVTIDGDLYIAEMTGDRVTRLVVESGERTGYRREVFFARKGCGPTALAQISEERLAVLCHLEGGVAIIDRGGALLRFITRSSDGVRLDSPNDISSDGAGGAFFSNSGVFHPNPKAHGRVMRLAPDLSVRTVAKGLSYANGVAVDRKNNRVIVSEHLAQQVLSFPLSTDLESLGSPVTLIDFKEIGALVSLDHPLTGPDGVELAPDGSVLVAIYGGGAYLRRAPTGLLTRRAAKTRFLCSLAFWRGRLVLVGAFRNDRAPYPGLIEITAFTDQSANSSSRPLASPSSRTSEP